MHNNSPAEHVATLYRFCSQSMQYPDRDWFNNDYLDKLFLLLETLGEDTLIIRLKESVDTSRDFLEDVQVEHTRLFINGVPHVASPPYGSVYIDKTIRGQYSDNILNYYNTSGYSLKEGADLPDSLIHQLEFLSFLAKDQNHEKKKNSYLNIFSHGLQNFQQE